MSRLSYRRRVDSAALRASSSRAVGRVSVLVMARVVEQAPMKRVASGCEDDDSMSWAVTLMEEVVDGRKRLTS